MIKIIKEGILPKKQPKKCTCMYCKSILSFEKEDVIPTPYPDDPRESDTIKCPFCGNATPTYYYQP